MHCQPKSPTFPKKLGPTFQNGQRWTLSIFHSKGIVFQKTGTFLLTMHDALAVFTEKTPVTNSFFGFGDNALGFFLIKNPQKSPW